MAEAGYILTKPELIYLVALTGTDKLLGVNDNTASLSKKEILLGWSAVKNSLSDKKYLIEDSDGTVNIHQDLIRYIKLCANPTVYVTCAMGKDYYFNCYMGKGFCVKLEESRRIKDTFILTPIVLFQTVKNLFFEFFEFFVHEVSYVNTGIKLTITKEQFESMKAGSMDFVNLDEKSKEAVVKVLRDENASCSMVKLNFRREGVNRINRYMLYLGEDTLWRLRAERNKKDVFILESIDNNELLSDLDKKTNLFRHFFETPVVFFD